MKTVFKSEMVAHIWANQSQHSARHSNHGHSQLYCEGARLYSYGSHYLAGIIMPDGVALVNADSNSKTTNKLVWESWHAVSHRTRYRVPGLTQLDRILPYDNATKDQRKAALPNVKSYIAGHSESFLSAEAAEYLLGLCATRNPKATLRAIRKAADAAKAKKAHADKVATRQGLLRYGKTVCELANNSNELNRTIAAFETINGTKAQIKKLVEVHKALKAAKHSKRALVVWKVLKLVRARLDILTRQNARKTANGRISSHIHNLRSGFDFMVSAFHKGECVSRYAASHLANPGFEVTWEHSRIPAPVRAKIKAISEFVRARGDAIETQHEKEAEAREAAAVAAWYEGGSRVGSSIYGSTTRLRAVDVVRDHAGVITGGLLQTSRGAEVPLTHAIKAFQFLKLCRERGRGWIRNGHSIRVGHFSVDRIEPNGDFKAGCHYIKWEEVEKLAHRLGVLAMPGDDVAVTNSSEVA